MPFVVYHNPEAPRERVRLLGVGEFVHGQGRRVDGDLLRSVLGEVTEAGHYARNVRFRPGVDPEIAAVIAAHQAATTEPVDEPELELEPQVEESEPPAPATGYWRDGGDPGNPDDWHPVDF